MSNENLAKARISLPSTAKHLYKAKARSSNGQGNEGYWIASSFRYGCKWRRKQVLHSELHWDKNERVKGISQGKWPGKVQVSSLMTLSCETATNGGSLGIMIYCLLAGLAKAMNENAPKHGTMHIIETVIIGSRNAFIGCNTANRQTYIAENQRSAL